MLFHMSSRQRRLPGPHDSMKICLRRTNKYGWAVYAHRQIRKGELVATFDGPLYDDLFEPWTRDMQNHTVQVGPNLWRDSIGLARWVNHSCEPNCGIRGLFQIVAMRTIYPGEEVTWDYEMTEKSTWWRMKCRCGSPSCRKIIGSYDRLPVKLRRLYQGYISVWLQPRNIRSDQAFARRGIFR